VPTGESTNIMLDSCNPINHHRPNVHQNTN
jgi:hypothetical protein